MRKWILGIAILCIASMAMGQSLTKVWAKRQTQSGGAAVNSNSGCVDTVGGVLISAAYNGATPSLYFFNLSDGNPATTPYLNFTFDATSTPGAYGGFAVGANGGEVFLYDDTNSLSSGNIQKLDNITDTQAVLVSNVGTDPLPLARNLSVEGSGDNTYIAGTGAADSPNAFITIFKSSDAARATFTRQGQIQGASLSPQGAAKSGVGMSVPVAGQPPLYVAGTDFIGLIGKTRLFKRTGTFPTDTDLGYTLLAEVSHPSAQAQIDLGNGTTEAPVVIVLENPSTGQESTNAAEVAMYQIGDTSLTEVARGVVLLSEVTDQLTGSGSSGIRGSLGIDRVNKAVYASYRGATAPVVCMAKFTYVLPPITAVPDWMLY